ncbi:MAG: aspartate-semialdehyde dehydrogenase [Clostridia bacterium]
MNLAIVGATGLVGSNFLKILEEKKIQINELYLFASLNSKDKKIRFKERDYSVLPLNETCFKNKDIDYALFAVNSELAKKFVPLAANENICVIDNSSFFRMFTDIPLIVPEVNFGDLKNYKKSIIANPNCSTIQAVLPLKVLQMKYGIRRVVVSTYQAVSGAGIKGIDDLLNSTTTKFKYPISYNCIAQIDSFLDDGYTKEEHKLMNETRKILNLPELNITATAIRVPTLNCHGECLNVELMQDFDLSKLKQDLSTFENIVVLDDISRDIYPMNTFVDGKDEVYIGRIRRDLSRPNTVNMWVMADNVRKGAATNAVQILEKLVSGNMA